MRAPTTQDLANHPDLAGLYQQVEDALVQFDRPLAMANLVAQRLPAIARPIPAILRGERWTVKQLPSNAYAGRTDVIDREMFAPAVAGGAFPEMAAMGVDFPAFVRLHEMLHAKLTPPKDLTRWIKKHPKAKPQIVQTVEDFRIQALGASSSRKIREQLASMAPLAPFFTAQGLMSALPPVDSPDQHWLDIAPLVASLLAQQGLDVTGSRALLMASLIDLALALKLAGLLKGPERAALGAVIRPLESQLGLLEGYIHSPSAFTFARGLGIANAISEILHDYESLVKPMAVAEDQPERDDDDATDDGKDGETDLDTYVGGDKWRPFKIIPAPLSITVRHSKNIARKLRPAIAGPVMAFPERYCSDFMSPQIFGRSKITNDGNGILCICDVSSSMGLTTKDIVQFAANFPGGTLATYDHHGLTVAVHKGRRVADIYLRDRDSCNGVDGPALAWAARQKAIRRYWVSDGEVNGSGEVKTLELLAECMSICRQARITNIPDIPTFQALMAKRSL